VLGRLPQSLRRPAIDNRIFDHASSAITIEVMGKLMLLLGSLAATLAAQGNLVEEGFSHFYNLEYDEAIACFQKAVAQNPNSPDLHNHMAQTLVFREMFRDGALESELVSGNNSFLRRPKLNPSAETEKQFLEEVSKALALSDTRLKADPNDTAAMYAMGIAYGLRSNYYWVVKKSWRDARCHLRASFTQPHFRTGAQQRGRPAGAGTA
jgi:tetratricopeptide (TPR) repeat protein